MPSVNEQRGIAGDCITCATDPEKRRFAVSTPSTTSAWSNEVIEMRQQVVGGYSS